MTILAIIVVILFSMLSSVSQAIGNSQKLLGVDDEARQIFDRMAADFRGILYRNDVDVIFSRETGGSDKLFFFSSAIATNPYIGSNENSPVSLVGYCIAPDAQKTPINSSLATTYLQDLLRLGRGLCWDASGTDNMVYLAFTSATAGPISATTLDGHWSATSTSKSIGPVNTAAFSLSSYLPPPGTANTSPYDADYHVLGSQVIRFEYCFVLNNGKYSNYPAINFSSTVGSVTYKSNINSTTVSPPGAKDDSQLGDSSTGLQFCVGSRWFDCSSGRAYICTDATPNAAVWAGLGFNDISAIIVAIVLVDRDSRKLVTSASGWQSLPQSFVDPTDADLTQTTPPKLMQQTWQASLNALISTGLNGVPTKVLAHTHIYQRYFYLNSSSL